MFKTFTSLKILDTPPHSHINHSNMLQHTMFKKALVIDHSILESVLQYFHVVGQIAMP